MSSAERRVRARVEENARVQQRKRSAMTEREGERETERRAEGKRVQSSRRSPVSDHFCACSYMYSVLCGTLQLMYTIQ